MSFRKQDVLALTVLGLFCLYLFRDIVLSGHLLVGIDFIKFYLPMKKFLYNELHLHHEIPFWNPYIFGGMPFWAHFESTIFYPLGFLFCLVSPEKAYGFTMFLHFFLAGLFMHILARSLGISPLGSFVAASVFVCNGFVAAILFLGHMSPVESYIWLPLVITFLHRAIHSPTPWGSAMIAGGLWGIQILAGAPQDAFYTFLASTLFLLCFFKEGQSMKASATRHLAIAAMVFVVGAGLSCIQILPALELIRESVRASLDSYEWSTLASYPLQGIITIFMPHFFGNYADGSMWVSNTPWSIPEQNLYTGILPLVLLGFLSFKERVKKRIVIFAALLAGVSLLLAFGHHTPIYKLVYLLPGFDRFRAPSKIMVLWVFSMALLAGIGMDGLFSYLRKGSIRRLYPILLSVFSLAGLVIVFHYAPSAVLKVFSPFVLANAIPERMPDAARIISAELQRLTLFSSFILLLLVLLCRRLLPLSIGAAALCALLLVDLGYVHGKSIRYDDSTYERIAVIKQDLTAAFAQYNSLYRVGAFRHPLGANLEMSLGYQTVGGFTALFPSRYHEYMDKYADYQLPRGWVSFFYGISRNHVMMDLLNVKYEISYANKSIGLRENCLPRAFIVPSSMVLAKSQILGFMVGSDFNPRRTILFEKEDIGEDPRLYVSDRSELPGNVEITHYRPDRIVLTAEAAHAAYLFLSEVFYPGWRAMVDGHPQRILRGNYLFRVVELPEGRHRVELVFDSLPIKLGMAVSSFVMVLFLSFLFYHLFFKGFFGPHSRKGQKGPA
jgi:uncharacterized membrane protein YfhO